MTVEEFLKEVPYSVGISKLIPKDKMIDVVDDYQIQLMRYSGGHWIEIKDFYGNNLPELLETTLQWCNENK